jgi:short-subunit dehydrogenase
MNLRGAGVLLTGATGGIGTEIASMLAARGAEVLLSARNEERLNELHGRLRARGHAVTTVVADVTSDAGRQRIVAAARAMPSGIRVLINNAGINEFGRFDEQTPARLESVLTTNALAPMLLTRALLPALREQAEAAIVNVGSIVGSIGLPGQVAYCASKFALHGFGEALRRELQGSGIDVLYVAPRSTDTDMNDTFARAVNEEMGVATDDTAKVAACLIRTLERQQRERFIGWPERLFVKLNALFPRLVDKSMRKQTKLLDRHVPSADGLPISNGVKQ